MIASFQTLKQKLFYIFMDFLFGGIEKHLYAYAPGDKNLDQIIMV